MKRAKSDTHAQTQRERGGGERERVCPLLNRSHISCFVSTTAPHAQSPTGFKAFQREHSTTKIQLQLTEHSILDNLELMGQIESL
jgi:hypothetical protein